MLGADGQLESFIWEHLAQILELESESAACILDECRQDGLGELEWAVDLNLARIWSQDAVDHEAAQLASARCLAKGIAGLNAATTVCPLSGIITSLWVINMASRHHLPMVLRENDGQLAGLTRAVLNARETELSRAGERDRKSLIRLETFLFAQMKIAARRRERLGS